jgi:radical SAM-linked protein
MAYSAGFTPHPKVSYANAAPTGTGSEAEYLEIALATPLDPDALRARLDACMPDGLDITDAVEVRSSDFTDRLMASEWELRLPGTPPAEAERAVALFLEAESVEVGRQTKKGLRTFDARAAVASLTFAETASSTRGDRPAEAPCAILHLVVRHTTPAVRPDDVLSGIRAAAGLAPPVPAEVTRLAQGPLDEETGTVTDPLAPDRDAPLVATAPGGSA